MSTAQPRRAARSPSARISRTACPRLPRSIKSVVNYRRWVDAYRKVAVDEKDNTLHTAMKRAGERLLKLRVIGRVNPYVWVTGRAVVGAPLGDQMPRAQPSPPPDEPELPVDDAMSGLGDS